MVEVGEGRGKGQRGKEKGGREVGIVTLSPHSAILSVMLSFWGLTARGED